MVYIQRAQLKVSSLLILTEFPAFLRLEAVAPAVTKFKDSLVIM